MSQNRYGTIISLVYKVEVDGVEETHSIDLKDTPGYIVHGHIPSHPEHDLWVASSRKDLIAGAGFIATCDPLLPHPESEPNVINTLVGLIRDGLVSVFAMRRPGVLK